MTKLLRIEADYFCVGVHILEDGTIRFPEMEPGAEITYAAFMNGLPLDQALKICERMKWKTQIL